MIFLNSHEDKLSIPYEDNDIRVISGNRFDTMDEYNANSREIGFVITKKPLYPIHIPDFGTEDDTTPAEFYESEWFKKSKYYAK